MVVKKIPLKLLFLYFIYFMYDIGCARYLKSESVDAPLQCNVTRFWKCNGRLNRCVHGKRSSAEQFLMNIMQSCNVDTGGPQEGPKRAPRGPQEGVLGVPGHLLHIHALRVARNYGQWGGMTLWTLRWRATMDTSVSRRYRHYGGAI